MNEEICSFERNVTWDLVKLPIGKSGIGVKWMYKTKYNENGKIENHKERLVEKDFTSQCMKIERISYVFN